MRDLPTVATMRIRAGQLDHPDVRALLRAHLSDFAALSPPESMHALDGDALCAPGVSFWSAWTDDDALLGFGALRRHDATHAEIKSMRTAPAYLRRGVGAAVLRHLIDEAARRGCTRVSLETGAMPDFAPAHRLYAAHGFTHCGPFADYVDDPNSVFMTKIL